MPSYKYNDCVYTLPELRAQFPNVSLPVTPTALDLEQLGVTIIPDDRQDEAAKLAAAQADKLALLERKFDETEMSGHFASSLGFEIDATQRTLRDIQGLITLLQASGSTDGAVCDYGNTMRPVTLEQAQILNLEILIYGQAAYARKWSLREAITAAQSIEELGAIEIEFDTLPAPVLPGAETQAA